MITDYLKERGITKEYNDSIDNATKRFLNQRNSMRAIYDTAGYKEIIRWLTIEKEAAMKAVMASGQNKDEDRARYKVTNRLLTFLDNVIGD